jgi:hypothetical protein
MTKKKQRRNQAGRSIKAPTTQLEFRAPIGTRMAVKMTELHQVSFAKAKNLAEQILSVYSITKWLVRYDCES